MRKIRNIETWFTAPQRWLYILGVFTAVHSDSSWGFWCPLKGSTTYLQCMWAGRSLVGPCAKGQLAARQQRTGKHIHTHIDESKHTHGSTQRVTQREPMPFWSFGPAPLQGCVGDVCCAKFRGFCRGFSCWGFFWALLPTKMRRENPATKSASKRINPAGQKYKSAKNPFCQWQESKTSQKGSFLFLTRFRTLLGLFEPLGPEGPGDSFLTRFLTRLGFRARNGSVAGGGFLSPKISVSSKRCSPPKVFRAFLMHFWRNFDGFLTHFGRSSFPNKTRPILTHFWRIFDGWISMAELPRPLATPKAHSMYTELYKDSVHRAAPRRSERPQHRDCLALTHSGYCRRLFRKHLLDDTEDPWKPIPPKFGGWRFHPPNLGSDPQKTL